MAVARTKDVSVPVAVLLLQQAGAECVTSSPRNAEGINPLEATPYFLAVDQPSPPQLP